MRGKQKPAPFWERAGVWLMNAQIYPVAPRAVARLMRAATGFICAFMAVLLCTGVHVVKRPSPLDIHRVRTLGCIS
jgi:hypothetical protein